MIESLSDKLNWFIENDIPGGYMATTYWVTGYSGAGKTTIGWELYKALKKDNEACVFLDGDILRTIISDDLSYAKEDRYKSAMRYAQLCELLTSQGIDVVCCTVSMFEDVRQWNRMHIKNYMEIYLKVPMSVLFQRDQKGLYSNHEQGSVTNVVGLDLQLEEPRNPDIVIKNDGSISVATAVEMILRGENYSA